MRTHPTGASSTLANALVACCLTATVLFDVMIALRWIGV